MRKTWRIDKRGIATAATRADAAASTLPDGHEFPSKTPEKLLSFLTNNMAAAIAANILADVGAREPRENDDSEESDT